MAVHPEHEFDPASSWQVRLPLRRQVPRRCVIYADRTYRGGRLTVKALGWRLQIVERAPGEEGFRLLPKRWVMECTFAWLGKCRRRSKDYEALIASSEAWIRLAMSRLMLWRLAPWVSQLSLNAQTFHTQNKTPRRHESPGCSMSRTCKWSM